MLRIKNVSLFLSRKFYVLMQMKSVHLFYKHVFFFVFSFWITLIKN